jgi:tRNA-2-methylthio-N6-dimethylallyladenosine synthase
MTYFIITYGCQMNDADSGLMAALLERAGWSAGGSPEQADLVVVNTCSVREKPERKVRSLLGELRQQKQRRPGLVVAVTGCMAQAEGERLVRQARHVDVVLGTRCFHHIAEAAQRALSGERPIIVADLSEDPAGVRCGLVKEASAAPLRAFVPVILGCANFCSYCIVPHVRGPEASRPLAEVVGEVRDLTERGTREVTLLGQNVLAWGRDLPTGPEGPTASWTFDHLLSSLEEIDGLWRVRFLTCHPRDVTSKLIRRIAESPKVCEHIHLPIQAGTDKLLREMNRGYTTDQYRAVVEELRAAVPRISVTTDIMVGFPGETEQDFESSLALYQRIGFEAAFTFAYSPRPGTLAAQRSDQVPRTAALARLKRLIEVQNRITCARNQREVGSVAEVLVEGPAAEGEGLLAGRTRHNKQVVFAGGTGLIGSLAQVKLTEAHLWGFQGEAARR